MDDTSSQASTEACSSKDHDQFQKAGPLLSDEDEHDGLLYHRSETRRGRSLKTWWIPTIAFFWVVSLYVTWKLSSSDLAYRHDSFQYGYSTDLEPVKSELEILRYKFVGDLDWDENGTLYRPDTPGTIKYVGKPSPEIDAAWKHLIPGEGVDLIGEEAKTIVGTTFQKPGGWWVQGVEVFHQLHCLNIIRKTIDIDYYGINEMDPATYRLHIEHCIDALRQSFMCAADISRFQVEWNEKFHRARPVFGGVTHTCRNFEKIRAWAAERDEAAHPWPEAAHPWHG
ncbi:hypothetical protein HD806DRAFT_477025 [Xylariaceae sp. AK1471]|nr:hypothetical protein HD806DRAFT_477025 [Xylariaceae sp. AK1471]